MLTIPAFVLALGILIAIHEYGHYRVAVACGVKVLRFSVGFGKVIYRWQPSGSNTEFVIGLFPLGGYVKMLDEREAPVSADERHLAFNTQPLGSRALIVAAGPLANLLLAVLLYSVINWTGVEQAKAWLASPVPGSIAAKAGLIGGEEVRRVATDSETLEELKSFEDLRWLLTRCALEGRDVRLEIADQGGRRVREVLLPLREIKAQEANAPLGQKIGLLGPFTEPLIGEALPGSAADKAGLQKGDRVVSIDGTVVIDGQQLRVLIRNSLHNGQPKAQNWLIDRDGSRREVLVESQPFAEGDVLIGRIGAYVGTKPEMVWVRYGFSDGIVSGLARTWEVSILTLKMMGKMLIGEASIKNLSGPLTIADFAGKSANLGITQYLTFLALISISLGVLNLLPLPVLDGGHLMYYVWEAFTGKPVTEVWMDRLQRGGVALLLMMMSVAIFNDVSRILG
jgi:regulator of sigma E protease